MLKLTAILCWLFFIVLTVIFLKWSMRRGHLVFFCAFIQFTIIFSLRPILFFFDADEPLASYTWDEFWDYSALASIAGTVWLCLTFAVYCLVTSPQNYARTTRGHVSRWSHRQRQLLKGTATAATVIAVAATLMMVEKYGNGSIAQFMVAVKVHKELAGNYIFRHFAVLASIFSVCALYVFWYFDTNSTKQKINILGIAFFLLLIAINMITILAWGTRMNVVLIGFAILVIFHHCVQKIKFYQMISVLALGATIMFTFSEYRKVSKFEVLDIEQKVNSDFQQDWTGVSASLHLTQFDALMLALRDTGDRFDFRGGRDFINGITSLVPRIIYPDKETYQIGGWFRRIYDPDMINGWPVTVIGGWYVNFGIPGIIFGAVLSGLALGMAHELCRTLKWKELNITYSCVVGLLVLNGGIDTGLPQYMVKTVIPMIGFVFLLHSVRPPRVQPNTMITRRVNSIFQRWEDSHIDPR